MRAHAIIVSSQGLSFALKADKRNRKGFDSRLPRTRFPGPLLHSSENTNITYKDI